MTSTFFTQQWADGVRDALNAGPDEQAIAGKLPEYWDFYNQVREVYPSSWALGVRGTGYLLVQWGDGHVTECRVLGESEPVEATYVLAADYHDWKALFEGYDALRTVMYRKLLLEEGDLLEFFKAIYFFVECLAVIATVPTKFPTNSAANSAAPAAVPAAV
jgi:hypothetical protein